LHVFPSCQVPNQKTLEWEVVACTFPSCQVPRSRRTRLRDAPCDPCRIWTASAHQSSSRLWEHHRCVYGGIDFGRHSTVQPVMPICPPACLRIRWRQAQAICFLRSREGLHLHPTLFGLRIFGGTRRLPSGCPSRRRRSRAPRQTHAPCRTACSTPPPASTHS